MSSRAHGSPKWGSRALKIWIPSLSYIIHPYQANYAKTNINFNKKIARELFLRHLDQLFLSSLNLVQMFTSAILYEYFLQQLLSLLVILFDLSRPHLNSPSLANMSVVHFLKMSAPECLTQHLRFQTSVRPQNHSRWFLSEIFYFCPIGSAGRGNRLS